MLTHKGTVTLTTERLVLRKLEVSDAQAMFDTYANDARVTKFLSWKPHGDVQSTKALLELWEQEYRCPSYYHWGITIGGQLIGSISTISISEKNENCEVGYCIAYDYWGKGIVAEALREVMRFLFAEVGMHRVMAKHDTKNPGSGRVMQKCGMTYEGTMKEHYKRHDGTFGDSKIYAILRGEFLSPRHAPAR